MHWKSPTYRFLVTSSLFPSLELTTVLILVSVIPLHVFLFWSPVDSSINSRKCYFACVYVVYQWFPIAHFILQISLLDSMPWCEIHPQ